jgi:hypothetical protein
MQILFRKSFDSHGEYEIAKEYCEVVEQRSDCGAVPYDHRSVTTVIGRYSVLPYYRELQIDLHSRNAKLINSYEQHSWIADFEYYHVGAIQAFTFPTFDEYAFPSAPQGAYVVKGRTNSRKHQWNTHMFAASKADAFRISSELMNDPLLGEQGIIYRKYIPLETFEVGINGLPFTNEWRFFFLGDKLLTCGYYWSQAELADTYVVSPDAIQFANHIAKQVKLYANFFVLDVAKTESGEWILVEINDGQMSGLCMCEPRQLYNGLKNEYNNIRSD